MQTTRDSNHVLDAGTYTKYLENRTLLNSLKWLKNGSGDYNLCYRLEVKCSYAGNRNTEYETFPSLVVQTQNFHLP